MWRMREGFQDGASKDGVEEVGLGGCLWTLFLGERDGGTNPQPSTPSLFLPPPPLLASNWGCPMQEIRSLCGLEPLETHGLDTQLAPLHIFPAPYPHLLPSRQRRGVSMSEPATMWHLEHHVHRYVRKLRRKRPK